MTVFCNKCGHRNPAGSNFCSSCGAPLDGEARDDRTITFHPIDRGQESSDHRDDVVVHIDELPADGAVLVVRSGPDAGMQVPLGRPVTRAGRHPASEVFLDDITVSRRHVEIERTPTGYVATDVGSLNGTYLNRERIDRAVLTNGDELQIGKFRLVFLDGRS
jgi:pSer/pThr/pTyr-binding forkhead associated (FHA) protein